MIFTELPKHWEVARHSEIAEINPKLPFQNINDETEVSFIPMKLVAEECNIVQLTQFRKYGEVKKGFTSFTNGDVIFAKITPCMENGKGAVVRDLRNSIGFGSTEFHVSRPKSNVLPEFIFYFLVQQTFRRLAESNMTGSVGQKRVPTQFFRDFEIPLPPLVEQQRIVAKLEELFSELDAGLTSLKTAAQQLKTYRQAVLTWAFEGKLTNDHVTEGELPAGWKWVKVSEIAEVRLGRQRSPQRAFGENMCQYLRAANVTWDGLDLSDVKSMDFSPKEQEIYRLQKGDILLSEASGSVSEVGKPAIWNEQITNCCFQNTLIRVRPGNLAGSKFLHLRFYFDAKVGNFRNIARGVGIHHLGSAGMSNWSIALPPLEEQHRIVQEIESRLSVCDKLEETLAAALRQAEALRQSILKQAFAGKLVAPKESDKLQFVAGSRNSLFTETSTN